jgi:hypothetical protein
MNAFGFERLSEPKRIPERYCSGIAEFTKRGEPVTRLAVRS